MRNVIWSLVSVTALALAGCNSSSPSSQEPGDSSGAAAATTPQTSNKVTGKVTLREPVQLSPQAKLDVSLVDVSAADGAAASAPLATKTISPVGDFPVSFELEFNPSDVNPNNLYVVKASLVDGERTFDMPLQAPVLTKGATDQVTIQLVARQTPAEKDLSDFESLRAQIGGMKIKSGTKLEKDASRGWQVFRKDGQIQFIREQVDYGDKGFTDTDYAYKANKPWVAVQKKKASKDAKPTATLRVSWDVDGNPVLEQRVSGGNTETLSADDASSLKQQAVEILKLAGGK
ncbi:YbaY family lipoprotein [Dyella sp.]|jgi:putative lipoprotein|uniref:YbaY family lipoprotein n=1 Tax=Dyella sp. TaxID=1869338 RepID=UPI002D773D5C|nr:YbaY family lipoprotein [Dyella sp.]HET6434049.1 YbaY family lipoprotein [Dyella sp.]